MLRLLHITKLVVLFIIRSILVLGQSLGLVLAGLGVISTVSNLLCSGNYFTGLRNIQRGCILFTVCFISARLMDRYLPLHKK